MNYDRWDKDKHKEFRRLKRSGYTDDITFLNHRL